VKEIVQAVVLFNRTTGTFESAEVFRELDEKNLDDFDCLWRPPLQTRKNEFASWVEAAAANAQDSHWDWGEQARKANGSLQYETFAVECGGGTQGLMLVDLTKFARIDGQRGRELVYVERIATAPWNRAKFVQTPVYKGVGRVLLGTAISLSFELGFKGRIGLHSLPQSENWYRNVAGFTDGGYEPAKMMHYFEMSDAQAGAFISDE
jgi:hypothetical protein